MIEFVEIAILPRNIEKQSLIESLAIKQSKHQAKDIKKISVHKRSIDARSKKVVFRLQMKLEVFKPEEKPPSILENFSIVKSREKVYIIGAGPAGYFAALQCIEHGLCPVIFERGKDVRTRRRDLRAIQQFHTVNPNSNYCYGEGGAGAYSDGKLYTRSHKRGNIEKTLQLLVAHGANPDILIDAHPHIGSNKLPKVVEAIRETILNFGAEIYFDHTLEDVITNSSREIEKIVVNEKEIPTNNLILATGHSARDIYYLMDRRKIYIEYKPFALGVRIEHPQSLIDSIQYRQEMREPELPAASYKLVCQIQQKGVFSFCMCPGGLVVPAQTSPGEMVVNGMSMSRRDSPFANAGTVTAIEKDDLKDFRKHGHFQGLKFQQSVEQKLFQAGDGSLKAPAQRLTDFVKNRTSKSLPDSSYIPGLWTAPLHELLPEFVTHRLQKAIKVFSKKMKGYYTEEANVIGTESRTSSPIRIPRNKETLMHPDIKGLFPCGEGAGYAGGILSAAMDGQNVANAVKNMLKNQ